MITATHKGNAIHVEGEDIALLDLVPLAEGYDVDEAVAALSAEWAGNASSHTSRR